jgi:hypothetical protein
MEWIELKKEKPSSEGVHYVYAPSMDPKKPFFHVAWWNPETQGWELIVRMWGDAITHWMKPVPPVKPKRAKKR